MASPDEPQAPARTQQQRLEALRRANEIRRERAQLKRGLAAITIEAILADPPQAARTAKVADLLRQLPHLGPRRVARLLAQARISEAKTVAGLSPRQRTELIRRM